MSPMFQTVALYAPVVIVVIVAAALVSVLWRRGFAQDTQLPLAEMMVRRGVVLTPVWSGLGASGLAQAARRCASCSATKACRAWLDSGRREGYEEFCANAAYIEGLK